MNGHFRLIYVVVGLGLTLCSGLLGGCVSILADIDHLVGPLQACGFPPSGLCLLAATMGRPWHASYVLFSGALCILGIALCTGLLLGAFHRNRARMEDSVEGTYGRNAHI